MTARRCHSVRVECDPSCTDRLVHGMHGQVAVNRERIPILYPAELQVLLQVARACDAADEVPGDDGALLAQLRAVLTRADD